MNQRLELKVKGNVQKVGYRAVVQKLGLDAGLTGYVENLPDLTVKVVVEGPAEKLQSFRKQLKIERDFIKVETIEVAAETEATGEYQLFSVKRGDIVDELGGRLDTGILHMGAIAEKIDASREENKAGFASVTQEVRNVGAKVDASREENKAGFASVTQEVRNVGAKVDASQEENKAGFASVREQNKAGFSSLNKGLGEFSTQTHEDFGRLDGKYHSVSDRLESIDGSLKDLTTLMGKALDRVLPAEQED